MSCPAFLVATAEYLDDKHKELFDASFTHYHDSGISGVLGADLAVKVVQYVKTHKR